MLGKGTKQISWPAGVSHWLGFRVVCTCDGAMHDLCLVAALKDYMADRGLDTRPLLCMHQDGSTLNRVWLVQWCRRHRPKRLYKAIFAVVTFWIIWAALYSWGNGARICNKAISRRSAILGYTHYTWKGTGRGIAISIMTCWIQVYAPTDERYDAVKDAFYVEL